MPIVYMEGFDVVPDGTGNIGFGASVSGTMTWKRVPGRGSGWALGGNNSMSGDSNQNNNGRVNLSIPGAVNNFSLGFALWLPPSPLIATVIYVPGESAGNHLAQLNLASGNVVIPTGLSSNMSTPAVASQTIPPGWSWWNLVGVLQSASAGFIRLYRNNLLVFEIAPDTAPNAAGPYGTTRIYLQSDTTPGRGSYLADIVARDDAVLIPDTRVDVLRPTSNSSVSWTPSSGANWECVDDTGAYDSDYVSSASVGATDLYRFQPLPVNPASITAVQLSVKGRKSDAGERTGSLVVNGTESPARDYGTGGATANVVHTVNPSGGAAWTKSSVDAIVAGPKVAS